LNENAIFCSISRYEATTVTMHLQSNTRNTTGVFYRLDEFKSVIPLSVNSLVFVTEHSVRHVFNGRLSEITNMLDERIMGAVIHMLQKDDQLYLLTEKG
jgi:hypothetical protein